MNDFKLIQGEVHAGFAQTWVGSGNYHSHSGMHSTIPGMIIPECILIGFCPEWEWEWGQFLMTGMGMGMET